MLAILSATIGAMSVRSLSTMTRTSWQEVIVGNDTSKATASTPTAIASSMSQRLKAGDSILLLHDVMTLQECKQLSRQCIAAVAQERHDKRDNVDKQQHEPCLMRLPTIASAQRALRTNTPCATALPADVSQSLDHMLLRVAAFLDGELPDVVNDLFGTNLALQPLLQKTMAPKQTHTQDGGPGLQFASREPAVNVYRKGGEFLAHTDGQALTVLAPLTAPEVDFQGGGTAFWDPDARGHRVTPPSLVLTPPPGTALLFGGTINHACMPVTTGTRTVVVASFSASD